MTEKEKKELIEEFSGAGEKLILLDYDGTLTEYNPVPANAILPEQTFKILERLVRHPETHVYIITGRGYDSIDRLLKTLPAGIIAEHGGMIRENGVWKKHAESNKSWKNEVKTLMEDFTKRCPGSFLEYKEYALAWHYRNALPVKGFSQSRELIDLLSGFLKDFSLKIQDGNKVVEIMPESIGKGKAVKKLLDKNTFNFVLSIGDDVGDEEMFEYSDHHSNAFTVKVGEGTSSARYRLAGVNDVVNLLKKLSS